FTGSGNISVGPFSQLPNVQITGTNYTILRGTIGGNLTLSPGAGNLNILSCTVQGACLFQGNAVQNFLAGSLDANGSGTWQPASVGPTPPATIFCAGTWTSNASFAPASGLVVLDGSGAQLVNMPGSFHWHDLRIANSSIVNTTLPVQIDGLLDVKGSLST